MKEARQRMQAVCDVQDEVRISYSDGSQNSGSCSGVWEGKGVLMGEGHEGASRGAGSVTDLDLGGDHTVHALVKRL